MDINLQMDSNCYSLDARNENRGLYFVFRVKKNGDKNFSAKCLIYIGQTIGQDIHTRLQQHLAAKDFGNLVTAGNGLQYIYCSLGNGLTARNIDTVEAALINYFKPCCNTQHVDNPPEEDVKLTISDGWIQAITGKNPCVIEYRKR